MSTNGAMYMRYLPLAALVAFVALVAACGDGSKPGMNVSIGSEQVRSCELLFVDKDAPITGVSFGASVKGTTQRWAPRTAVAFTALTDAPLSGNVLTVQASAFDLVTTRCYDHEGKPVASPDIHF